MSFDKDMVRVYNHNAFGVALQTNERNVFLRGTLDPEYPIMETFSFRELEYVNSHSPVVRNGIIQFSLEEREEIYKALHVNNWEETCVFEQDIDKMLTTATFDTMRKVVEVKDLATIDRIYAHMKQLIKTNFVDVSSRVQKVVTVRRNEIREGILTSKIQLIPKKAEAPKIEMTSEEISKLVSEQVAAQMAQLVKEEAAAQDEMEEKTEEQNQAKTTSAPKAPAKKTVRSTKTKAKAE